MDTLSPDHRSWNMSRIRGKNTKPELIVRSYLHHLGYRFRLHKKDLPGSPDIVLPRYKLVIFVHGCYWHRHKNCKFAYTPKSNTDFWLNKFEENTTRDQQVQKKLRKAGWRVALIWQCQAENEQKLKNRVKSIFAKL